jgi:hypothetical protein
MDTNCALHPTRVTALTRVLFDLEILLWYSTDNAASWPIPWRAVSFIPKQSGAWQPRLLSIVRKALLQGVLNGRLGRAGLGDGRTVPMLPLLSSVFTIRSYRLVSNTLQMLWKHSDQMNNLGLLPPPTWEGCAEEDYPLVRLMSTVE